MSVEPTASSLANSIRSNKSDIDTLTIEMNELNNKLKIYATIDELKSYNSANEKILYDTNTAINSIEQRLQKISLPNETRFYLKESEITDFRKNFRMLRSGMAELEASRQAFIKLASRYNMTNSQI